jgi:hypothetical protein
MESAKDRPPVHNMYYTRAEKTKSSIILKDSYYIQQALWTFMTVLGHRQNRIKSKR